MNDTEQARALALWLDGDGGPASDVDADVLEAIYVLRPDLAPAPQLRIESILDSLTQGPLVEPHVAAALAQWLSDPPGTPPPRELPAGVVESTYALQPERAPAPKLSIQDVLSEVSEGPLAQTSRVELQVVPQDETAAQPPPRRWGGPQVWIPLAMAAGILLTVMPQSAEVLDAPSPFEDSLELASAGEGATGSPLEQGAHGPSDDLSQRTDAAGASSPPPPQRERRREAAERIEHTPLSADAHEAPASDPPRRAAPPPVVSAASDAPPPSAAFEPQPSSAAPLPTLAPSAHDGAARMDAPVEHASEGEVVELREAPMDEEAAPESTMDFDAAAPRARSRVAKKAAGARTLGWAPPPAAASSSEDHSSVAADFGAPGGPLAASNSASLARAKALIKDGQLEPALELVTAALNTEGLSRSQRRQFLMLKIEILRAMGRETDAQQAADELSRTGEPR